VKRLTDDHYRVLSAIELLGDADLDALASALSRPATDIERMLADLEQSGLIGSQSIH